MNDKAAALGPQQVVESAWRDQAIWSETANRLKAELSTWRNRAAVAGVLGAFLETLAGALSGLENKWWWLRVLIALAGAIILAVVPYVVRTKASKDRVREWVRARSVSEALKETIYRYLVGVPPFGPRSSPADLIQRGRAIKEKVRDLSAHAASVEPPRKERPLTLTVQEYVETRVNDQIDRYYRPKGRENAIAAKKLHNLEFCLGLLAVGMGALASAATATGLKELSRTLGGGGHHRRCGSDCPSRGLALRPSGDDLLRNRRSPHRPARRVVCQPKQAGSNLRRQICG